MKALCVPFLFGAFAMALAGCESDMPPEPNRPNPIQRGITGEGRLYQQDKHDDPFINEPAPADPNIEEHTRTGF